MTVTVPTLDDLGYDRLLADITARISAIDPQWTDHSPTEPGIVLLELFCWLTDMTLWRLDRLAPAVVLSLLDLLAPRDTPAAADDSVDAAVVAARAALRTPHRAVTADDYRRLLAAGWPGRRFAVHAGEDLSRETRAPGHVSVVVAPEERHLVARLRLHARRVARIFSVEQPGLLRISVGSAGIAEGASPADIAVGAAWILLDDIPDPDNMSLRTLTLIGPDGQIRAQLATADARPAVIIEVPGAEYRDGPAEPSPGPNSARCWLHPPPSPQSGETSARVHVRSGAELRVPDGFAATTSRLWTSTSHVFERPVEVDLAGGAVDLVVCLTRREPSLDLVAETTALLAARKLLGTRLHVLPAVARPVPVSATLYLAHGADPGFALAGALERLERWFRGLEHPDEPAVSRPLDPARLLALLSAVDGVEFVELPAAKTHADLDDGAVRSLRAPELAAVPLRPTEVAALADAVELTLVRRGRFGGWEIVK